MAINLIDLAHNLTPEEYAKIILSSGDYFPGFYRFTMGTRKYESGQINVKSFIKTYFDQEVNNKKYLKEEWFNFMIERLNNLDDRIKEHSDIFVYETLKSKYKEWVLCSNNYDICLIETNNKINLHKNKTYFFMGTLIRFSSDEILLGYNDFTNEFVEKIPLKYEIVENFLNKIYKSNFSDLFIPAKVIGSLIFSNNIGTLITNDDIINNLYSVDDRSAIIASNNDLTKNMSMRWAKDIILSNFYE